MADQQILKEYLLSLGFKIDSTESKKFDTTIGKFDLNVKGLAMRAAGAALAVQAMVAVFARSMEKLYYSSMRAESTAGNIKAIEFAAGQVGVGGDKMRSSLEAMARAMRANPGLKALLNDLGVAVEGRDKADVLTDLVTQLKSMPFEIGSQFGSMFGIDPDDLLLLQQQVEEFKKARDLRKEMARDAGLDVDAAAKAGKEYSQLLNRVIERMSVLKDIVLVDMLPGFTKAAEALERALVLVTQFYKKTDAKKEVQQGVDTAGKAATGYWDFTKKFWGAVTSGKQAPAAPAAASGPNALFSNLEGRYGLPSGLLDKMWAKESSRGKNMLGPQTKYGQAKGHFQFLDATAKEMGVSDPFDLTDAAQGTAKYMAQLMKRYGGDIQKALAAYNWGMGNVDRKGMANAPWETQDYVASISGRPLTIQQTNTYQITTPGAEQAIQKFGQAVDRTWADITRNIQGAVQ